MEEIIKELISRVNSTLGYYEKDYISVKRTPWSDRERCETFEQYIEARFNYECSQIPELQEALELSEGHLFCCTELLDPDTSKRRFSLARVELVKPEPYFPESLNTEIEKICKLLGGRSIKFNNVKKKIKFTIEE